MSLAREEARAVAGPAATMSGRNSTPSQSSTRLAPLMSSASAEWYTPSHLIPRIERALGGRIDLDPCADPARRIPARQHYTAEDDGLSREWRGAVFMNSPYGDEIKSWTQKLHHGVTYGRVTRAIALVPARTGTKWWTLYSPSLMCFLEGRLRFERPGLAPDDKRNSAPFPSALWCYGDAAAERDFIEEFRGLGIIMRRAVAR